jgi:hypothetical protein
VSFFFGLLKVFKASGPFRIRKNVPQNKPIDALTKRLSHEFRNKIERPSAMRVRPFIRRRRSDRSVMNVLLSF